MLVMYKCPRFSSAKEIVSRGGRDGSLESLREVIPMTVGDQQQALY